MNELLDQINAQISIFTIESEKQFNGNSSAGTRARKATLNLDKLFKQFRKESVSYKKQ